MKTENKNAANGLRPNFIRADELECFNHSLKANIEKIWFEAMSKNMNKGFKNIILVGTKNKDMENTEYQEKALRTESKDIDIIASRLQDNTVIRLLHVGIGLATEAAEVLDALKKHIFYGKDLDKVNIAEEIGDSQWYAAIGADALNTTLSNIQNTNIEKLVARYPDKFCEEDALIRNLAKERKILEK